MARWGILVAVVLAAGMLAKRTGIPAAWLVGPMVAAMGYALASREAPRSVPRSMSVAAQATLGVVLAASFRPSTLPTIAANLPAVILAVGGTMIFSLLGGVGLSRFSALDPKTAAIGTLPGAASGMIVISDSLDADTRMVALIQYSRVVLVVLSATLISRFFTSAGAISGGAGSALSSHPASLYESLPLYGATALVALVGAWGGKRIRIPAGTLIGPLILGAALKEAGLLNIALPSVVPQLAYAVIGVSVGLLFDSASVRRAARLLPAVLASTLGLMAGCAGLGWLLSSLTGSGILTGYLATTPGGLSSVAVIAVESGTDPSLPVAVQMLRVFAVIFTAPLVARWLSRQG